MKLLCSHEEKVGSSVEFYQSIDTVYQSMYGQYVYFTCLHDHLRGLNSNLQMFYEDLHFHLMFWSMGGTAV